MGDSTTFQTLFEDIFDVEELDFGGKKFAKGTTIRAVWDGEDGGGGYCRGNVHGFAGRAENYQCGLCGSRKLPIVKPNTPNLNAGLFALFAPVINRTPTYHARRSTPSLPHRR
jgi:hypothetical protein